MKKILSVLLSVALLLSFAACNTNKDSKDSSKPDNSSSAQSKDETSSKPTSSSQSTSSSKPKTRKLDKFSEAQYTASSEDIYSNQIVRYELNSECKGYYFTPKAAGKYPTVVLIHGASGVTNFKDRLLSNVNKWVKEGYIPPMVIVIPEVLNYTGGGSNMQDFQPFIESKYPNRFAALLTSIEDGSLSSQIDTNIAPCVAGYSMGGMVSLQAGVEYNTRIRGVGALSPSQAFYMGEDSPYGIYKKATDIKFSSEPDAHVFLTAAQGEENGVFVNNINRYRTAIYVNNPDIIAKYTGPASWGEHGWAIAHKEIFIYLCFVATDKIPSQTLVETVCGNPNSYTMPSVVSKEEEHTN